MTSDSPDHSPATGHRPQIRLVLGKWTVAGPAAVAVVSVLLALVVALIVRSRPSLGMLLAGGVWLGFLVFWSLTAGQRVAQRSQESPESRRLHRNLLNLGLLLLFISIPGLRWSYLAPNAWHLPLGLGIMGAATLLHMWARAHLGRNWSHRVEIHSDHQLVRSGPYRIVRHPIYTAIVGLAIGTALVSGRVVSLLGAGVFTFAYVRKLRMEERVLGETFGAAWHEYRKRSWALLPGLF